MPVIAQNVHNQWNGLVITIIAPIAISRNIHIQQKQF